MPDSILADLPAATDLDGTELFYAVQGGVDVKATGLQIAAQVQPGSRVALTGDTTYYVATTGNDTTGTGAVGAPWATVQKAYDVISTTLDFAGFNVTIQLADGTYAKAGRALDCVDPWVGGGSLTIQGNLGDRTAVKLQRSTDGINIGASISIPTTLAIKFLQSIATDASFVANISHVGTGSLTLESVDTGGGAIAIYSGNEGAIINIAGDYSLLSSGTGISHIESADGGVIFYFPNTIAAVGTINHTNGFATIDGPLGFIEGGFFTTSGTFTGKRFTLYGGVLLQYTIDRTDFPGDAEGVVYDGEVFVDHRHGYDTQTNVNQINDKGTVNSGTVTFDRADGAYQKLTVGGAIAIAFSNWGTGIHSYFNIQIVNGGTNVTWPTINWIKSDGSTTTTFSDTGSLQASGTNFVRVWSTDAGTTIYGRAISKMALADITGLGANVATFLTTPSSANLIAAVTDETGSGALVFADTPTLVTPLLGTPTSGTLTNCTGLPVGGVSGLGANVATFLATPSSANLISAVTDETGSGALVFADTPTLISPVLGTPTSGTLTNCTGLPATGGGTGQSTYAKGDILVSPGSNTLNKLAVSITDGQVLTVDAASTNGVKWAAAPGGGLTIGTTAITGGATTRFLYDLAGVLQESVGYTWDSTNQAATIVSVANPSAPTLTLTGATALTTSQPVLNMTQTWNAVGTAFTGINLTVTKTAAAAASTLFKANYSGGSTVAFAMDKVLSLGTVLGSIVGTSATLPVSSTDLRLACTSNIYFVYGDPLAASSYAVGAAIINVGASPSIQTQSDGRFGFVASSTDASGSADTILTRGGAAATLQYGAADAAAPVAQTLQVQSVVAGTTDTAGVDWTIQGSRGTGTGAGGAIIFKTAPAGTTGTSQNAAAEQLRIGSTGVNTSIRIIENETNLADGANVALDASLGNTFKLVAAGDRSISVPTNKPASGKVQKIVIMHTASAADRTLTLTTGSAGAFRFGTDITALSATTSGKTDYIGCIYSDADDRWDVVSYVKGF